MFNSLVFGGIDSAEYGIYITGEAVYNAPERAVELVSVPGRNGQVAIDQGRWENVEVTYPAGCFGDSQADFAQKISAFRNAIASKIGYQRLTDTYNSDEYRMAMYTAGLEVNAENKWNGTAGEFNITFNCKPQRWLTSGETPVAITSGDELTNPTQYEARPLLAVMGDGTIDLAGQTIELIHQDLGDVDLFGAETKETPIGSNASATAYTFVLGTTDYFPSALLNQSDEITIRGATVGLRCDRNTRITAGSGTGIDGVTTRVGSSSIAWDFPDITIGFKDGTTYQAYTNNDVRVKNRRTGVTYTYRMTVQFKAPQYASGGQVQIEVTLHKSSADPIWVKTGSASWQSVTAYSTASGLGNPTYIDCDLGEAYMYIGDDLYSLNGNIDLGSDVPVLKGGVNEITYDNTITELKITPRWWKL